MNTTNIGEFLATLRKEKNLTQEQLGEILGVTNKTVSRWENGNYMPPVEALQQLSEFYQITINEILSGKRLSDSDYKEMAEQNIKNVLTATALSANPFSLQERISFYKRKWRKDHVVALVIVPLFALVLFLIGLLATNLIYLCIIALFLGMGWHIFQYNRMMAYVEQHAFDGTGNESAYNYES